MMFRITLLGDSNLYRFVTADRLSRNINHPVCLINTARRTTLELGLQEVAKDDSSLVVLSALANLIHDAG